MGLTVLLMVNSKTDVLAFVIVTNDSDRLVNLWNTKICFKMIFVIFWITIECHNKALFPFLSHPITYLKKSQHWPLPFDTLIISCVPRNT